MTKFRHRWMVMACALLVATAAVLAIMVFAKRYIKRSRPIKVGIVHSLTGPLAVTEKPIVDATMMAIDEINQSGGINGRSIKPFVVDGKSHDDEYVKGAVSLIEKEKVVALFGPWKSTTRAALKKIAEQYNILLFYPAHDEGLEDSPNVVYTGSMPNQTILPAITWCFFNLGKSFFLIGSNNLFPRVVQELIADHVASLGGTVLGSLFVDSAPQLKQAINQIYEKQPAVIINVLDANMNIPFFKGLRARGITSEKMPTMSFSFSEIELKHLDVPSMIGDYAAWTYFDSIYREENIKFVEEFKKRFGDNREINSNMESAYSNVHLWAQAAREARSTQTDIIRPWVKKQVFNAPGSIIYLTDQQHAWRYAYIGKIRYDGTFDIIWNSKKQIKPLIYPPYKTKEQWDTFVRNLS